jgi:hypothetical protein
MADQESIDVVVHAEERLSLILAATNIGRRDLGLAGTLIDPDISLPVEVRMQVGLDDRLAEGAHVERVTEFTVEDSREQTSTVRWNVESTDLGGGYRLHDARVDSDLGDIRAFAIEDLAASVGVALVAGVAAAWIWKSRKKDKEALALLNRLIDDCKQEGGRPRVTYGGSEEAEVDVAGKLKLRSGLDYNFECLSR